MLNGGMTNWLYFPPFVLNNFEGFILFFPN